MLISALTASLGLSATYFSPWIWRRYRMSIIRRRILSSRTLVLTYDDGPSASITPELLDLLARHESLATFFMLGEQAKKYPQIVDRAIDEGHEIGCHSHRHVNAWKVSPWRAVADIRSGYECLSAWIPSDAMFRPPYGKMTLPTYLMLRRRGASVFWWTVDSGDTHVALPDIDQIVATVREDGGGIVLMHDLDRVPKRNTFVLEVTEALLDLAKTESLKVMPLRAACE